MNFEKCSILQKTNFANLHKRFSIISTVSTKIKEKRKKKEKWSHLQTQASLMENAPVTTKQLVVKEHVIVDIV